jgi:hypothetical protein
MCSMLDIQARWSASFVLGSERLQAEARTAERQRDDVVIRDERVGHIASLHATLRRPRPTPRCRS